jgi:hypothetical protein
VALLDEFATGFRTDDAHSAGDQDLHALPPIAVDCRSVRPNAPSERSPRTGNARSLSF